MIEVEINDEIEIDTLDDESKKIVMAYGNLTDASWKTYKAILSIQDSANYADVTRALRAIYSELGTITEKLRDDVEAVAIVNDAEPGSIARFVDKDDETIAFLEIRK